MKIWHLFSQTEFGNFQDHGGRRERIFLLVFTHGPLTFEGIWNGCWKSWQSFWVFFQWGKPWWTPGSTDMGRAWKTLGSRHSRASENGNMRYGTFSSCSQSWGRYMHVIILPLSRSQEHGQQGNTLRVYWALVNSPHAMLNSGQLNTNLHQLLRN